MTIKNHLIGAKNYADYDKYYALCRQLYPLLNDKQSFFNVIESFVGKCATMYVGNDYMSIFTQIINPQDKSDLFIKTLKLNTILFNNHLCPLVCYAFGKWQIDSNIAPTLFYNILELTVMSLYRVVPHTAPQVEGNLLNDTGGIFDIYKTYDNKLVRKTPKSYAAFSFLAQQEFESYKFFSQNSELLEYLPDVYTLDTQNMVLSHSFIKGDSGDYMLMNNKLITDVQKRDLAKFYDIYLKNPEMRFLDIHPGNFIWNTEQNRWLFIDMGLIPYIGSEYYKKSCFNEYYHDVWETRLWQIAHIPIRSFDYGVFQV
ncbi:MAG: hypothetical protein J6W27_02240 [Alphaproteobacteria bacterium]|nr:hypothetical protein [Alphaproteobacteria bacterium]